MKAVQLLEYTPEQFSNPSPTTTSTQFQLNFDSTSSQPNIIPTTNHPQSQYQSQLNLILNLNTIWLWHKINPILLVAIVCSFTWNLKRKIQMIGHDCSIFAELKGSVFIGVNRLSCQVIIAFHLVATQDLTLTPELLSVVQNLQLQPTPRWFVENGQFAGLGRFKGFTFTLLIICHCWKLVLWKKESSLR